ncbi:MAG: hypothetical protein D6812_09865 [Deltaproteobacteria bacterium]|nr:MAG: hypothetical protein D6812_09865 [Deltaproteobacteria bacterium]
MAREVIDARTGRVVFSLYREEEYEAMLEEFKQKPLTSRFWRDDEFVVGRDYAVYINDVVVLRPSALMMRVARAEARRRGVDEFILKA